ncbi:MAG TPA: cytochrome P450 [Gemmatimonadaceae bacterium]|nr:cytochrome P450 [Gemmatimonadaceae bacterium]
MPTTLPSASLRDAIGFAMDVFLPTVAKGVIIRRPRAVRLAASTGADERAIRRMQRLRENYGSGPVVMRMPGRVQAVILAPEHARRVLDETPEPFATDSTEKIAALSHFEPGQALISHGRERAERRQLQDAVLESACPRHRLAERFITVVRQEAAAMLHEAGRTRELAWADFNPAWHRVIRRVVLGDSARDDHELTDLLGDLRRAANWAFFHPGKRALRAQFFARLESHLARAESGSLAAVLAATPKTPEADAVQQVPQWLFAFDAAGMATFRALALLVTHPSPLARAREEIRASDGYPAPELPFLRACILESVRLWATTPMILRQTTALTTWESGTLQKGAGVLIFVPYFDRDDTRAPFANSFEPDLWLGGAAPERWPLIPFSLGPAVCPGRQIVQLTGSAMLDALLQTHDFRLASSAPLSAGQPIPPTLDPFSLRFALV